jgi:hypothetical protein
MIDQKLINRTCNDLKRKIGAKAIFQIGSTILGKTWNKSDVDLFIICDKAKKHAGFLFRKNKTVIHCNVASSKQFREMLKSPSRLAIHGLLSNCKVIIDDTNWLSKEKARIAAFPHYNRTFQIINRSEQLLDYLYHLEKHNFFNRNQPYPKNPQFGFEKLLEIMAINNAVYFGRSVYDSITPRDKIGRAHV